MYFYIQLYFTRMVFYIRLKRSKRPFIKLALNVLQPVGSPPLNMGLDRVTMERPY